MSGPITWADERGGDSLVAAAETAAEQVVRTRWSGAEATLSHVSGGLTNHNFRVHIGGDAYFLQVQGDDDTAESLGINREGQVALARRAHALGLGPEVIFAGNELGPRVLITRLLRGSSLAESGPGGFADPSTLRKVGRRLRILHESPPLETAFSWAADPFDSVRQYSRRLLPDQDAATQRWVGWAHDILARVAAVRGQWTPVPAHCDLVPGNIVAVGGALYFVDWEYSGMGDALFDIADCCAKCELTPEQTSALLEGWGSRSDHDACIVAAYAPISMIREAFWGLVARDLGWRSDIDYGDYALGRFESARDFVDVRDCLRPCAHRRPSAPPSS